MPNRLHRNVICISTVLILVAIGGSGESAAQTAEKPELARARTITRDLESGRIKEAVIEAEGGAIRFPQDYLIRRRVAQSHLMLALQYDRQLEQADVDRAWARTLDQAVRKLKRQLETPPKDEQNLPQNVQEANKAGRAAVLNDGNLAAIRKFQTDADAQWTQAEALRGRRNLTLGDTLSDVAEARRLGDRSTELELTRLWTQVLALIWQKQPASPPTPSASTSAGKSEPKRPALNSVKIVDVLRAAEALGNERPSDPAALAGAADILSVVAALQDRTAPWQPGIKITQDRYWRVRRPAPPISDMERTQLGQATQAYLEARKAPKVDVSATPWTLALQFYLRAVEADPKQSLPLLRPRVYQLQRPFEPAAGDQLLEEISIRDPQNAFVPLERARTLLFTENRFDEAVEALKRTDECRTFQRSYVAAVPIVLRRAGFLYQRNLREVMGINSSDCDWAYAILEQARLKSGNSLEQGRLRELRLHLASLVCGAPDYFDAIAGAEEVGRIIAAMAADAQLPSDRQRVQQLQTQLTSMFSRFPRSRDYVVLTKNGMITRMSPNFDPPVTASRGWSVLITQDGTMLAGDFKSPLR